MPASCAETPPAPPRLRVRAPGKGKGFSLLEMLLALVILGLTVGVGVSLVAENARRTRTAQTLANAERIAQALGAYVAANKRLPCAADPAAEPTGTAVTGTTCTSLPRGLVPWSTLGLQLRDVRDGHGRFFSYHVDPAFTAGTLTTLAQFCSATASTGLAADPDKPLKVYAKASGTLAAPSFSAQLLASQAVPFVLLASGANGFGAWVPDAAVNPPARIAAPPAALLSEALNAVITPTTASFASYVDREWSATGTDPYDDAVFYKSVPAFIALYAGSMC